jgi:hypothetical protein
MSIYYGCECEECKKLPLGLGHTSDCAVHSEPAYPKGECNCGALYILYIKENWDKDFPSQHLVYPTYIDRLLDWIFGEDIKLKNKRKME